MREDSLKLAKTLGRIGFAYGFVGSLLFYAIPPSLPTWESHLLCPQCPYITILNTGRLAWVEVGLRFGLVSGLVLALVGFAVGFCASRVMPRS